MTKLFEEAIEAVRGMPPSEQDAIAQAMLGMARIGANQAIDPEHLQDVLDGLAEIARGELATVEEVEAAFRHFER